MKETRTIKIHLDTYRLLKILAAENGEKLVDLIDRLASEERSHTGQRVDEGLFEALRTLLWAIQHDLAWAPIQPYEQRVEAAIDRAVVAIREISNVAANVATRPR